MNICNSQFSRNIKKDPEGIPWAYWLYSSIFFKQNQLNIYSIQLLIVCNLHICVFSFQIFFQVRCFSFFHGFLLVSRNLFGRYVKGCVFCISSKWIIAMPDNKKGHLPLVFLPKEKCPFIHLIFEKCSSKIINILLVNT